MIRHPRPSRAGRWRRSRRRGTRLLDELTELLLVPRDLRLSRDGHDFSHVDLEDVRRRSVDREADAAKNERLLLMGRVGRGEITCDEDDLTGRRTPTD